MKQLKNEIRSNYSMLIMTWASKSNCSQRAGRVGRVANGRVYRLIPRKMFNVISLFHFIFIFIFYFIRIFINHLGT